MAENCVPPPPPTTPEPPSWSPPSLPSATDLEAAKAVEHQHQTETEPAVIPPPPFDHARGPNQLDWHLMVIGFCFQSAVGIAVQSLETKLPIAFHFMRLAMIVSVAALCIAKYICIKFPIAKYICIKFPIKARVLEHVGIFFGITAFFVAVTVSFPLWLELTSWIIFALSLLAILFCNYTKARSSLCGS